MRSCEIYINGIPAGLLTEKDNTYIFKYHEEYLKNPVEGPVSLTLPLTAGVYTSPHLFPAFANMLTEGANRQLQSDILKIDIDDDFGFLLNTCRFDAIGPITVKPMTE